jgi:hypothetical protein
MPYDRGRGITMSEVLTAPEIEQRFPSEWILVDELQTDEHLEVLGGRVLFHSPDRDEVYRKAVELHPKRFTVMFTGKDPDDTVFVL